MNPTSPESTTAPRPSSVFRNWMSLMGFVVMVGSIFSFLLLLLLDTLAHASNPYIGILTYLVAPAFLVIGVVLSVLGAWFRHRQVIKTVGAFAPLRIHLTRRGDRRKFGLFLAG